MSASAFVSGGGVMGARVRAFDWAATPLGALDAWSITLRITVDQLLASKFPTCLFWGPDLIAVYNDAYRVLLGAKPEALGEPMRITWAEAWEQLEPIARKALAGESTFIEDYPLQVDRHGAREEAYFTFNYGPVFDEHGVVVGLLDTVVETTRRMQTERSTRAERERLHNMLQQMPGFAALLSGPLHVFQYVNDAYVEMSGPRQFIGRTVREVFPELQGQGYFEMLDEVYATGRPYRASAAPISLAGQPGERFIDLLYAPIRDEQGQIQGVFAGGYDITDRVLAEKELRESDARLRALNAELETDERQQRLALAQRTAERDVLATIVQTTDAFIQVLDLDYRFLAINRANADEYERIFGKRPAVGDSLLDLLAPWPDEREAARAVWGRAMAGESFTVEGEFGDPGRSRAQYEMKFEVLRNASGQQIGAFETSTDITERLRAQHALAQAQEALRQSQKMEAVGQLTGGIAHDFNNLLAAIGGCLQVARARLKQGRTDELPRYLDMGESSVRRAASLTQRLLAFSRRQTLDPRPTDINRLVDGMTDLITRTVGPAVRVTVEAEAGLWATRVDASQLENALLNLCINSRDALPDGGQLTVSTCNVVIVTPPPTAADPVPGDYVLLSVADNGTGMSPEVVQRVFDPFFTTKPIGQGTGLGLSMVYGLVRQSGGRIYVDSELGRGTVIRLYLPRYDGPVDPPAADPPAQPAHGAGEGETVLLIEDEDTVRHLLSEMLAHAGYAVLAAGDGPSGLRMLQGSGRIDLLVTDVGLPGGMNGRQVADAGRALRPGLKVLFITGYAESVAVGNGLMEPGMEVMGKPFDVDRLAVKVREMLTGG